MPTHDEAEDQPSMTLAGKTAARLVERKKGEGRLFLRDLLPRACAMSWARGGGRGGGQEFKKEVGMCKSCCGTQPGNQEELRARE